LKILAALALILTVMDNWTTYVCLRAPVSGWVVQEANPIGARLFESVGLVPGLSIDLAVTLVAVVFLLRSRRLSQTASACCLSLIAISTAVGVGNNLKAISDLGLW
jgi:hypothetical protein